jgi:hypothetical protein
MRFILVGISLMLALIHSLTVHAARNLEIQGDGIRHALVIGNNHYQSVGQLEKAGNDARAMGQALENIGYQTTLLLDANRRQMNAAINRFVDDIAGGGVGVLFFAGHGVQINNQNFLLPVDIEHPRNEADIGDQAVSLQSVQDKIAQARARFTLLVVDACRNNPLPQKAGRHLGGTRGLALASSAEGQMVIFSAGANQLALDKLHPGDRHPNGLFTRELLPWLNKPDVSVRQAILEVRRAVYAKAKSVNHDQFPAVYDQVLGDFHFAAPTKPSSQILSAPPPIVEPPPRIIPPTPDVVPVASPIEPAIPTPITPTVPVVTAGPSSLRYAALGLPSYRSFWKGVKRDAYTRQISEVLQRTANDLLGFAPGRLDFDQQAFNTWWNEAASLPRSRELCAASPAPRGLLGARVETPPVYFTDVDSAYWPELKMRLVLCADLRVINQSKTLSPQAQEPWPFATEFSAELERFLHEIRNEIVN